MVTRHAVGTSIEVGSDIFAVLEDELAAGAETDQWFGYFGYASRPDLPAAVGSPMPDAVWMRARHVRLFEHEPAPSHPAMVARKCDRSARGCCPNSAIARE